jgi:uncharacterized protein YecE (DUF72 family)
MRVYIGTSGWSYDHWQGVLYPPDLSVRSWLELYSQQFQTVELNSSYYRWPNDATFANWQQRLPDGFLMSVKAPGGLTHRQRLVGPGRWLARINRGVSYLGSKLGIILVQLPPNFECDPARLADFLAQKPPKLRLAVEFRQPSWHQEMIFNLLEQYGVAYCVMSGAQLPCILRATAPFVYVRLHGPDPYHLYAGSYSEDDLRWWAERIGEWVDLEREVFVYFNNDGYGHAVRNADRLRELVRGLLSTHLKSNDLAGGLVNNGDISQVAAV